MIRREASGENNYPYLRDQVQCLILFN